ncbi:uncharacterized protein LOC34618178 [Cyclospora cayetanensis]|nr:uncharacterized protein LOC34618178 [Cyclospora cayetanensis]
MAQPEATANAETSSTTPAQTAASSARPERSENFILVSLERTPRFYARIGKRILMGREGKEAFDEFSVSGLGMATKVAIGTAALLQDEGCVTIEKVETAYFASARRKFVPKITILCKKTKDFMAIMEKEKERAANCAPEVAQQTPQPEPVKA